MILSESYSFFFQWNAILKQGQAQSSSFNFLNALTLHLKSHQFIGWPFIFNSTEIIVIVFIRKLHISHFQITSVSIKFESLRFFTRICCSFGTKFSIVQQCVVSFKVSNARKVMRSFVFEPIFFCTLSWLSRFSRLQVDVCVFFYLENCWVWVDKKKNHN